MANSNLEAAEAARKPESKAESAPISLADGDLLNAYEQNTREQTRDAKPQDSGDLSFKTTQLYEKPSLSNAPADANGEASPPAENIALKDSSIRQDPMKQFGNLELTSTPDKRALESMPLSDQRSDKELERDLRDYLSSKDTKGVALLGQFKGEDFVNNFDTMVKDGSLSDRLKEVEDPSNMREISRRFAQLPPDRRVTAEAALADIDPGWATQMKLAEAGVPKSGAHFNPEEHQHTMKPIDINYNWSGSGITGINPVNLPAVDFGIFGNMKASQLRTELAKEKFDKMQYERDHGPGSATGEEGDKLFKARWWARPAANAIESLVGAGEYLGIFDTSDQHKYERYGKIMGEGGGFDRVKRPSDQEYVKTFLEQPISTADPQFYAGEIPSRADVLTAAGRKYGVDPRITASFMLKEQWEQTQAEDATDLQSATSIFRQNSSAGIAQINVSNATKNGGALLSDTVDPKTRASMSHADAARYLVSDEHAIFAATKFIRNLANSAPTNFDKLPKTKALLGDADPAAFHKDSKHWRPEHIAILGGEYTSKPWDDNVSPWGRDIVRFKGLVENIWPSN